MSYTTPSTAVTGGTLTTTMWNNQVRDNLNYLKDYNTALAGTAGTAINVTTIAGTAWDSVNLTATQGSVVSLAGTVNILAGSAGTAVNITATQGSVVNIVNQPIGTAITSSATPGSTYTLVPSDSGKLLICAGTASGNVKIPDNATAPFAVGQKVDLVQMGTGTVTVGTASGVTLRSTPSAILRTQYSAASVIKIGTDEWLLMGDLL